jgi:uncharacterized protein YacL
MKKIFSPAALLFYLLSTLVFFILGMSFAGITGAAENQGLAGGAIVVFYGIITAILAFVVSLFVAYRAKLQFVVLSNKVLSILLLCLLIFFTIKFYLRKDSDLTDRNLPAKTTLPLDSPN